MVATAPRYQELLKLTGDPAKAREQFANELADQVPLLTAAGTALGTVLAARIPGLGGDATAKTLVGGARMTKKELAKRVGQDTIEEGMQGVPEDYTQHLAMVQADKNHKFDLGSTLAQNMTSETSLEAMPRQTSPRSRSRK